MKVVDAETEDVCIMSLGLPLNYCYSWAGALASGETE